MKVLYDEKFKTITLEEIEQYVNGKISLPRKSILLTFDDGYEEMYKYVYPILKKYNLSAVVFLIISKNVLDSS